MDARSGSRRDYYESRHHSREGEHFDDDDLINTGWRRTIYDYQLASGEVIYQQCRYDPNLRARSDAPKKKFMARRPAKPNDQLNFVFGPGPRRVIYRWPEIMRAGPGATVFVTEGEQNSNDLIKAGVLATTVISHRWTDECAAALQGYDAIIL